MSDGSEETASGGRRQEPAMSQWRQPVRDLASIAGMFMIFALLVGVMDTAAAQTAAPSPVTVSTPLQKEITEWDEFTGQFAAIDYVEIRARVSGYLTEIHFED